MIALIWDRIISVLVIKGTLVVQRARESQWFLPLVGAIVGATLSLAIASESRILTRVFPGTAWQVTATEARNVLLVFIGMEITALSIVMSLTMVTIQNAANQFSPRLLRVYLRDRVQKLVLSVIAGSTAYFVAASVLIGVTGQLKAAPQPVIGLAVFLIPLSGIALVIQINHTLQIIRIEVIMHKVTDTTINTADHLQKIRRTRYIEIADRIKIEPWAVPVKANRIGYVVQTQFEVLRELAQKRGYTIRIDKGIGEPVASGVPMGWVQPPNEGEEVPRFVKRAIRGAVGIDKWRDPTYDVALGIRQLVDVAIKALSPAVNDPRTAVQAIDHLTEILIHLAGHDLGENTIHDESGRVLVQIHNLDLFGYMVLATDQISRYGRHEPAVVLRLLQLCGDVGLEVTCPRDRQAIIENLWSITAEAEKFIDDPFWLDIIHLSASDAEKEINGTSNPDIRIPTDL